MPDPRPYRMTIDLNVLNHLGINLYSNNPAVLAEAVANAWDADAERVDIRIDAEARTVVIEDDGHGMAPDDFNAKFLRVGRRRREDEAPATARHGRPVMGRKGIGKLSLFSIADVIEVQSAKDGRRAGLTMSRKAIEESIAEGDEGSGVYHPEPLPDERISIERGTRIELREPRKGLKTTERYLRRRLARRFSVIGPAHAFAVAVNGEPVGPGDRHYYPNLEYVWHYGDYGAACAKHCGNAVRVEGRGAKCFEGWLGTVKEAGQLKDENGESLNKILVMARGKLVQEDILGVLEEGGLYTKYLIGEVQADDLDRDDLADIATTSRQALVEDDPRLQALEAEVAGELSYIRDRWTAYRNADGAKAALSSAAVKEWFGGLGPDDRRRARQLFGKINALTVDRPDERAILFKHGVLAFQYMRAKQNLDALDGITAENIVELGKIFQAQDDIEATAYYQIVKARLHVIRALVAKLEDDALERTIQEHLFKHLWLLDPSWERATATETMERRVAAEFAKVDADLSNEVASGRIDIKYRAASGKHVIVELKRGSVVATTAELLGQVDRYRTALHRLLEAAGERYPSIETVCVVGRPLRDWSDPRGRQESQQTLRPKDIRVVLYDELIENAERAYQAYVDESCKARDIIRILDRIDEEVAAAS